MFLAALLKHWRQAVENIFHCPIKSKFLRYLKVWWNTKFVVFFVQITLEKRAFITRSCIDVVQLDAMNQTRELRGMHMISNLQDKHYAGACTAAALLDTYSNMH